MLYMWFACLIMSALYATCYYLLITLSPVITVISIYLTWSSLVITNILILLLYFYIKNKKINPGFYRMLRVYWKGYRSLVLIYFFMLMFAILTYLEYQALSILTITTALTICMLGIRILFNSIEPMYDKADRELVYDEIMKRWDRGHFTDVILFIDDCSNRDICEISRRIYKKHGADEADMFQLLL